jgi:hypothetical protein
MHENFLFIFVSGEITPRMLYVFDTLFCDMSGIRYQCTSDPEDFNSFTGPKLRYGGENRAGCPFIQPSGLLSETGIRDKNPEFSFWQKTPVLFRSTDDAGILPFDLFAASFFLLTRYEEYIPFKPDVHGRFPGVSSLMGKNQLLHIPLVDLWLKMLKEKLEECFDSLSFPIRSFKFIPTIDADSAWAILHKPLLPRWGAALKELVTGLWNSLAFRFRVWLRLAPDPFDTWNLIGEMHRNASQPLVFFLLGKYNKYNKNSSVSSPAFRNLIRKTGEKGRACIHPSYEAAMDGKILLKEVSLLRSISDSDIFRSRQHFLRFRLPETYRNLLAAGIREDYSMGYADIPGFRAGTCKPFFWYDLDSETSTLLKLYPITVMDGTLKDYLKLSPADAMVIIRDLQQEVNRYGGTFVSVWHNESLCDSGRWAGWREVYAFLLNHINTLTDL